jgi:hypothetical protein
MQPRTYLPTQQDMHSSCPFLPQRLRAQVYPPAPADDVLSDAARALTAQDVLSSGDQLSHSEIRQQRAQPAEGRGEAAGRH